MTKVQMLLFLFVAVLLSGCQAARDYLATPGAVEFVNNAVGVAVDLALGKVDFVGKAEVADAANTIAKGLVDEQAAKGMTGTEVGGIAAGVTALGGVLLNIFRNQKYKAAP